MKKPTKASLFLELAKPDKTGLSKKVYIKEFIGKYSKLAYINGNPWARSLNQYKVYIHLEKGKTEYIQLRGLKDHSYNQSINLSIRRKIKKNPCVVLNTTHNLECDHKDGFKAFDTDTKNQKMNQFQPMNRIVNQAKREHCKKCKNSKERFDAKLLGYKKSVLSGSLRYEGTCEGCYWHDPFRFNGESSI